MDRNARAGWKPIPMPKTCALGCPEGQISNAQKRDQAQVITFFYHVFEHGSKAMVG